MEPVREISPGGFDVDALVRFADLAAAGLSEAREEIDALNVYPVPDGDTGTNMFLTMQAAREALRDLAGAEAADEHARLLAAMTAYSRGALLGARGNSGVILSQLVGALLRHLAHSDPGAAAATVFASGMHAAADAAYAAVGRPVEGTILTVARAASQAAEQCAARPEAQLGEAVCAAAAAARTALERTPEQLALLRDAGVVDAGGRGLCVVLDAAETALTGRRAVPAAIPLGSHAIPQLPHTADGPTDDLTEDGPAYEVMYLLEDYPGTGGSSGVDERVPRLRTKLSALGDSVVVVGGDGLWNVHVHTDDVGAAVEAGIDAGRPRRIRVTHFAEQVARARERRAPETGRTGRRVVAVVAGPGLARVFEDAGATVIVGGPGRRPSTAEVLSAIEASGAAEVIVLPNDSDSVGVAQAAAHAAEEAGQVHAVVIPTRAQVQGIAAMAVHEPARALDADVVQMTDAARGARHGAVTIAARAAMTSAGPCETGDVLGVVQGDFVVVGDDLDDVAHDVLRRLLAGGGELVTLVAGKDSGELPGACRSWVEREYPGVDVVLYDGGQDRYPLLLAVE